MLNVIGGKITTYRRLAEDALSKLRPYFPDMRGQWTAGALLPGGDVGSGGLEAYRLDLTRRRPGLDAPCWRGLPDSMGRGPTRFSATPKLRRISALCSAVTSPNEEVTYLKTYEWAAAPEDVLWRRTKTGLPTHDSRRARRG